MKRRTFLQHSLTASAAYSALPILPALGRTRKYRLAIIGSGWWGMNILREAIAFGDIKVVGMADVDRRTLEAAAKEVESLNGDKPKLYADYRDMLQAVKAEIVIVGTPDHWHALNAIEAIQSGAHVYLEKPISHTLNEGLAIFKTAREYERIVQVGTHRRVSPHNISAMEFLREGKVGDISMVKCFVNYGGKADQPTPDSEVPEGLDWDMWCGPAPKLPFNSKIHPKGWRQFLEYANGHIADWGIHWFDQVLWWTEERYPRSVYSTGGRFVKQDNTTSPDTQMAIFEFESFTLQWENKRCAKNANEAHNVGCYFYGTEGTLHLGWRDGWTFYPSNNNRSPIHVDPQLNKPDDQNIKGLWKDFMQSIENNSRPVCDIEHGFLATNMSLLGMLSYKLGRSVDWDGEAYRIIGDPEANGLLKRDYRGDWEYPVVK
ncbi:MAG: Gfo/Idh/MocA family oxidoreductase [Bacteroidota bacterium]